MSDGTKGRSGRATDFGRWLGAHRQAFAVAAAVVAAFVLGYSVRAARQLATPRAEHDRSEHAEAAKAEPLFWTCSMHPHIRQPGPGKCPVCAMPLIPVHKEDGGGEGAGEEEGPRELRLSEAAQSLADVQTAPVERRLVEVEVRMVGRVEYDETRLKHITAWVGGRIDRLYVDYTGVTVKAGDHMVWLYSPEILAAQEELLQAIKAVRELARSGSESVRRTARQTVTATREKLRLWGLTPEQITEIENRGKPSDHITIHAPLGGIVVRKHVVEGAYVKTGTRIYAVADLSQVWVKLDAYESDLPWVRYGQEVEFATEAYPGEVFTGKIAFVDPVLDEKTRTVKVRVNVPNEAGRLKPGMFVRAVVRARAAADGTVADPDLAGKWISPMHPEIVKDAPGRCDVCGMPLVRAETLGYVPAEEAGMPLVIPASAPLITGERAVVYVAVPGKKGAFEGREIVLGPRAGDHYIVKDGLEEGESVVTRGNFKIDSALQILAKPSMMNPEGGGPAPGGHHHGGQHDGGHDKAAEAPAEFREQLGGVFAAYFEAHRALSRDEIVPSQDAARKLQEALDSVDMMLLKEPAHSAWMKELRELTSGARDLAASEDITRAREAFHQLSETLIAVSKRFGLGAEAFRFRCPMAFGGAGAEWLSNEREVRNPYFGASMPKCGDVVETIPAGGAAGTRRGARR